MTQNNITWEMLIEIEPGLEELYKKCSQVKDLGGPYFCANEVWSGYKNQLEKLVGWYAIERDVRLNSPEAYRVAYKKCYDALPPCRDCLCI